MDLARFEKFDVVLICGLPGSGKSHFAKLYFEKSGRMRVNRKEIRKFIFEMINFGKQWSEANFSSSDEVLVRHTERKIVEHLLQNKNKILIDDTSTSSESRKNYIGIVKQAHKTIGAIFIHTSPAKCIERNRVRQDPIPEIVISKLAAGIEIPETEEGFGEVLIVSG
jgi:predicted kinase